MLTKRKISIIFLTATLIIAISIVAVMAIILSSHTIVGSGGDHGITGLSPTPTPTPAPTAAPTPIPTATPTPAFSGTISNVTWTVAGDPTINPLTAPIGSTLTLTATLKPTPLTPQSVWFYYSQTPINVSALISGADTGMLNLTEINAVTSVGDTATTNFQLPAGSCYFIAMIPTPT